MKKIEKMKYYVCDELDGAMKYAEKYIEMKASGNSTWANRFRDISNDELTHAAYMYDYFNEKMKEIESVYTLSEEEYEEVEHMHKKYADKLAIIKHMLSM